MSGAPASSPSLATGPVVVIAAASVGPYMFTYSNPADEGGRISSLSAPANSILILRRTKSGTCSRGSDKTGGSQPMVISFSTSQSHNLSADILEYLSAIEILAPADR